MENKERVFNIKNRSSSMVVYKIPELGIRREFAPFESKKINYDELERLTFIEGGKELLESFLQITSDEVIQDLNIHAEPEYFMSEQQVAELITKGTMDQFLDALEFAPIGVQDLIKQLAIAIPMTDMNKIEALKKKTGFDVSTALSNKKAAEEDETTETKTQEASTNNTSTTTGRRSTVNYREDKKEESKTPEYKIISE